MELSIFDGLDINDINGQLKRINAEALQTNSFSSIVTICALLGPKHTHQISSFKSAISEITFEFAKNGILITYTEYDNDHIRVNSWSPTDAFDKILAADCHILLGPIHIGLIGGNDRSWNSVDVIANIDRLEYHVGIPNARYINCPLLRGGKYEFYHALSGTRLCAPTTCIPIFPNAHLHDATLSFVERFVTSIREQCPHFLDPEESFVVKLPFSDCGHYAGAKMAVKHSKGGVAGICNSLREFVTGEYCQHIIGVIPYVILQPDILTNTVAEILVFNGEVKGKNVVKRGHGPSSLGRDREPLYEFATLAVSELKRTCLTAITDQFLCVKVFRYNGNLILNSIGGFNAECDPIEAASEIDFLIRAWWLNKLRDMIVHVLKQRRTNGVIF